MFLASYLRTFEIFSGEVSKSDSKIFLTGVDGEGTLIIGGAIDKVGVCGLEAEEEALNRFLISLLPCIMNGEIMPVKGKFGSCFVSDPHMLHSR